MTFLSFNWLMNRNELIKQCRYYDGSTPPDLFHEYEKKWVDLMLKNPQYLKDMVEEYKFFNLENFNINDGVPIGIKAILFNRYLRWCRGYGDDAESFRTWYIENYLDGASEKKKDTNCITREELE